MDFDNTDYEYLPECTDGCGAITEWLRSKKAAHDVAHAHDADRGHHSVVRERMRA
ncbi:hypothetical protein [Geobacter sp. DSM 9736]|uniref:hypothetical protein n=1 Tax=Geobacter sp. DSM 9736 TaxID=1277350 RepID=UPI000B5FD706|nr:hypothetical protein [Geobacter sp. DSM 9736]SNB47917.1 hypothetical protein SAMN06269301_3411 [Geobacter sp. DSM 9736]